MIESPGAPATCSQATDAAFAAAARRLPRLVVWALAVAALVVSALLILINRPDWWRGFLAAGVVSALSAGVSLVPLIWGLRGGLNRAPAGLLAATGLRALLSLGGCALAVGVGGYPAVPTFMIMMAFYVAVLATETAMLSGVLWSAGTAAVGTRPPAAIDAADERRK